MLVGEGAGQSNPLCRPMCAVILPTRPTSLANTPRACLFNSAMHRIPYLDAAMSARPTVNMTIDLMDRRQKLGSFGWLDEKPRLDSITLVHRHPLLPSRSPQVPISRSRN